MMSLVPLLSWISEGLGLLLCSAESLRPAVLSRWCCVKEIQVPWLSRQRWAFRSQSTPGEGALMGLVNPYSVITLGARRLCSVA